MPKFSELTAAGTLAGTEIVAISQSGSSVRTTATALANTASAINATVGQTTPAAGSFTTITATGNITNSSGVGTVTTAATTVAQEHGDGVSHVTKLTMTSFAVGTNADNASLGIGAKFYTFPAGAILVEDATMVGGLTAAISVTTDTPEVGIGTAIASGAVSVLSGTATFEDIINGNVSGDGGDTVAPDVAGTTFYKNSSFTAPVLIKTSGGKSHDLFLNVADGWADVTAAGDVTFTGVITLKWRKVS